MNEIAWRVFNARADLALLESVVLKRSMRPGFAGVDNDLYYNPKCMMLFGDAKDSMNKLLSALK